jgi:hypothetical protein
MRETNNSGGEVYGFITTGKEWKMFGYDGTAFVARAIFTVVFENIGTDKEKWMRDYSAVVGIF